MSTEGHNPYDSAPEKKMDGKDVVDEEFISDKDYLKEVTNEEAFKENSTTGTEWVDGNHRRSEKTMNREERYRNTA